MGVKLNSSGGGSVEINPPSTASTFTLTAPAITDTIVTKTSTDTLTNKTLTSPTITGASMSSMASSVLTSMTSQASTSGTSIDFTGIPSWVKRVTMILNGISTSGTSMLQVQIGAGSIVSSGYIFYGGYAGGSNQAGGASFTSGLVIDGNVTGTATSIRQGIITFANLSGNTWTYSSNIAINYQAGTQYFVTLGSGSITLSGALDRVRLTTVNGTDTFDAGTVNVMYE